MKNILIFFVLFVYIQGYTMEKKEKQNNFLRNDKFFRPLFLNLAQTTSMFETTLIISQQKLFLCQVCDSLFHDKALADLHGSQCSHCKCSIPQCALKAHESICCDKIQQ